MALSGVRSSWLILARNCDLCWLATPSCRLLSSISWNRRAFWIASTDCAAKVCKRSIVCLENYRGCFPADQEGAHYAIGAEQRDNQNGAVAGPQDYLENLRRGLVLQVGDLHRRAFTCRLSYAAISDADAPLLKGCDQLVIHPVGGALAEGLRGLLVFVDRSRIHAGELYGLADNRVKHLLQIECGVHSLADFAERAQLCHRLRQLLGALLHLFFEVRVGLLQLSRHVVELLAERFKLVAGSNRDALGQVTAADAGGASAQRLDWAHHLAREQ